MMKIEIFARAIATRSSLPTPNVQSLAAEAIVSGEVPERFIRPNFEADIVFGITGIDLPVIDMGRLLNPEFSHEESAKLGLACELGFFQLINHGVPYELIEEMKSITKEFFKLPLEVKRCYKPAPNSLEGYGGTLVISDEQKLGWADALYLLTRPLQARDLGIWPASPPSFRDTLSDFSSELSRVTCTLLEAMANNLRVTPEALLSKFKNQSERIKFSYYPPCPKPNKVLGLGPHSDGSIITILLEVNNTPGLQIKINSKWLTVQPLQGALLVNCGDILEILSNGMYKSIEHRVTVNSEKERMSITAFQLADQDASVGPLPELVKDCKAKYRTLPYIDYVTNFLSKPHEEKSQLEDIKISSS